MLNFAIIDDDEDILNDLSKKLEKIFFKHNYDATISCKTSNANELLSFATNNQIDALILDIEINSYMHGLEIAEKIRQINKNCYLIFETGHLEFGLMAYRYKTFDYLSKPITYERLEDCINRLFEDIISGTKKFIRLDNKNTIIVENEIKYIEKDGMKTIFHTNSRDYEVYGSFNKIQRTLPSNFVRCHRSFIVNIDNISKIEAVDNLIHFDKFCCDIGPKYKNDFLEVINNYGNIK